MSACLMMTKGQLTLKKSFRKVKHPSWSWQGSQHTWRKNAQVNVIHSSVVSVMPCISRQNRCCVDEVRWLFFKVAQIRDSEFILEAAALYLAKLNVPYLAMQWTQWRDRCGVWCHAKTALEHREKCWLLLPTPTSLVMMWLITESLSVFLQNWNSLKQEWNSCYYWKLLTKQTRHFTQSSPPR